MVASLKFTNCRPLALCLSKSYLSCDHPKRENYLLCFPSKLAAARKSENGMKRGKKTCFSHVDTVHFKFIQISSFVLFCLGNMNLALELSRIVSSVKTLVSPCYFLYFTGKPLLSRREKSTCFTVYFQFTSATWTNLLPFPLKLRLMNVTALAWPYMFL